MLTTTMSPLVQNDVPSYQGMAPVPVRNPPPWIHTSTGRRPPSAAGVVTLSVRQSSSITFGGAREHAFPAGLGRSGAEAGCVADAVPAGRGPGGAVAAPARG